MSLTNRPQIWRPAPRTTWQWQLGTGDVDLGVEAAVFDVDGFEVTAQTVARLHDSGRRAIAYVDAGSWEDFRPDAGAFPGEVLGRRMEGWADERWLDIRQVDVLAPIMAARFDLCRQKGFDAIEADNVDGYDNRSGFRLTRGDQLTYNRMLADLAHRRGMSIGLKNSADLVADLVRDFDFAVVEQCFEYDECEAYVPFIEQGKAVLHVEYNVPLHRFCATTGALGFSSMRKKVDLDAWRQVCL